VADRVDIPKKRRYDYQTLSAEQVQKLLAETASHRLAALFVLAVSTGMRPGELLGLRWSDIDFTTGEMAVQHNLQYVDGVNHLDETKTATGHRSIKLTVRAYNALIEHQHRQEEEQAILADQWDLSWGLVFCTLKGKPLHRQYLESSVYKPALRRAGLPDIRLYDLRHTAATLLMEAGVHPKVVAEILGHSSITLTLGTYSHVLPHMHAEAIAKLGEILGGELLEQTHQNHTQMETPPRASFTDPGSESEKWDLPSDRHCVTCSARFQNDHRHNADGRSFG
jgi:integrase